MYPNAIIKSVFKDIRPRLESVREQTKERTEDLDEVFYGVLCQLKAGANGACCRASIRSGVRCTSTSPSGVSLIPMA